MNSGGKQLKNTTYEVLHTTETKRRPQTKIKGEISVRTHQDKEHILSYAKRVAAETETDETAWYPQEKDRMKQTMSKSKSKKGKEEKKK